MKRPVPAAFAMNQLKKGAAKKPPQAPAAVSIAPFGKTKAAFPMDAMHAPNAEKRRK